VFPDIRWISPGYGFGPDITHVGVPEIGLARLHQMARGLIGTPGLVAIYIPEGTEIGYPGVRLRGKVAGAVRLLPMPPERQPSDFFYRDLDGSLRWPYGWPCQAVYAPPESECPSFREHVEHLFGGGNFGSYVSQFQRGPFELTAELQARLNRDFAEFMPLI
jgi:hypothetical protein